MAKQYSKLSENVDIFYPVLPTLDGNLELRYSLRSLANIPHGKVFIYTSKPIEWLSSEAIQVPADILSSNKFCRVNKKIEMACRNEQISENFVLMNDDFFILKPIKTLPYYADAGRPSLTDRCEDANCLYKQQLAEAAACLRAAGKPCTNYEMHIPLVVNKAKMLATIKLRPTNGARRSLYCNLNGCEPTLVSDCKIYDSLSLPDSTAAFCSSYRDSFYQDSPLQRWLEDKFRDKCIYEK